MKREYAINQIQAEKDIDERIEKLMDDILRAEIRQESPRKNS